MSQSSDEEAPSMDECRAINAAIVKICCGNRQDLGTGFFIRRNVVLTSAHVIENQQDAQLRIVARADGPESPDRPIEIRVRSSRRISGPDKIPSHPDWPDIAILDVEIPEGFEPKILRLGSSFGAKVNDIVYSFGYTENSPRGKPVELRLVGPIGDPDRLEFTGSSTIVPGLSGAPLFHLASRCVIGMITHTLDKYRPYGGRATHTETILSYLPELRPTEDATKTKHRVLFPKRHRLHATYRTLLEKAKSQDPNDRAVMGCSIRGELTAILEVLNHNHESVDGSRQVHNAGFFRVVFLFWNVIGRHRAACQPRRATAHIHFDHTFVKIDDVQPPLKFHTGAIGSPRDVPQSSRRFDVVDVGETYATIRLDSHPRGHDDWQGEAAFVCMKRATKADQSEE